MPTSSSSRTVPEDDLPWRSRTAGGGPSIPHLVVIWSLEEPERTGEALPIAAPCIVGRGAPRPDDPLPRAQLVRQRPGETIPMHPLQGSRISRVQLRIEPRPDGKLEVTNVGQSSLSADDQPVETCVVGPGSTLTIKNALSFLVVERPRVFQALRTTSVARFEFGRADRHGIVGESAAAWSLRDDLAFVASATGHVLVRGASGVGKELAATAIHTSSSRAAEPLVARNAATFPEGLVDAELFGNIKGYPNPGMIERTGVIGEADGSTLFLDEIGELPPHLQAHLLRVLDANGEYTRLGEATPRHADLRFVAATNRALDELKHDFVARFTHQIELPGLERRREDIPLLCRYLLTAAFSANPLLAPRFSENGVARLDPALVDGLVRHKYTHHLRELQRLVWLALSTSREEFVALTPEVRAELDLPQQLLADAPTEPLEKAQLEAALAAAGGNVSKAARALGLKNRFALYRLLKDKGIAVAKGEDTE